MKDCLVDYTDATGESATYRKGSSDYHTLKYVNWLENKLKDDRTLLEEALEILSQLDEDDFGVTLNKKIKSFLKRAKERLGG